ncbi:MAG: esterase [Motilibacteraceae bacterium]
MRRSLLTATGTAVAAAAACVAALLAPASASAAAHPALAHHTPAHATQPVQDPCVEDAEKGTPFAPLTGSDGQALSRTWCGRDVDGSVYRIEVPTNWNGQLVLWEHGYRGTDPTLYVDDPGYGLRQHYVEQGYAWAASSYSANGYDIPAAVSSTHRLGTAVFHSRTHLRPKKTFLQGISMGGHIIAVLMQQYPKAYDGAVPMCGVLGGDSLFDYYLSDNLVAQTLSGLDRSYLPGQFTTEEYKAATATMVQRLGLPTQNDLVGNLTTSGQQLEQLDTNLTGGPRPGADAAFRLWFGPLTGYFLFGLYGADPSGTVGGIAPGEVATNVGTVYDPNPTLKNGQTLNEAVPRVAADPRSRNDRRSAPIPDTTGRLRAPVLSLHDLGDHYVPFSMEQIFAQRAAAQGDDDLFVSRAIRAANHCEFSDFEAQQAFDDLTDWVAKRDAAHRPDSVPAPAGDDILNPAAVADPDFGCQFSNGSGGTRGLYDPCRVSPYPLSLSAAAGPAPHGQRRW